jgi:hypothetical protein
VRQTALPPKDYENLIVVTLGCGVHVPAEFKNVHQYLGTWDLLGRFNTPWIIDRHPEDAHLESIEGKAHNLSLLNPMHMPVEDLLRQALQAQ